MIISFIDPYYNSYINSLVYFIKYQQGGLYNYLNPLPAWDFFTLNKLYKGGLYNHLNPLPAWDPFTLNKFYKSRLYNYLNPPPTLDYLIFIN